MKEVRCKGYKDCEYKKRCAHSDIHDFINGKCRDHFNSSKDDPDNIDCVCNVKNIRKEKIHKIYERR